MEITEEYLEELFKEADASPRLRTNVDLRNSEHDGSQRMLNVLLPGTKVDIHRHPMSSESVLCLVGRIDEVLYVPVRRTIRMPGAQRLMAHS